MNCTPTKLLALTIAAASAGSGAGGTGVTGGAVAKRASAVRSVTQSGDGYASVQCNDGRNLNVLANSGTVTSHFLGKGCKFENTDPIDCNAGTPQQLATSHLTGSCSLVNYADCLFEFKGTSVQDGNGNGNGNGNGEESSNVVNICKDYSGNEGTAFTACSTNARCLPTVSDLDVGKDNTNQQVKKMLHDNLQENSEGCNYNIYVKWHDYQDINGQNKNLTKSNSKLNNQISELKGDLDTCKSNLEKSQESSSLVSENQNASSTFQSTPQPGVTDDSAPASSPAPASPPPPPPPPGSGQQVGSGKQESASAHLTQAEIAKALGLKENDTLVETALNQVKGCDTVDAILKLTAARSQSNMDGFSGAFNGGSRDFKEEILNIKCKNRRDVHTSQIYEDSGFKNLQNYENRLVKGFVAGTSTIFGVACALPLLGAIGIYAKRKYNERNIYFNPSPPPADAELGHRTPELQQNRTL